MPGTSKSAWNNWRNLAIRSVRGTLSPRTSTARPQSSLIKTFGSAAMAFVAAVADADAISSDMIARKIRRDISAELPFSFCRQLPFGAMRRSGPPTLGGDIDRRSILSQIGTAGTQNATARRGRTSEHSQTARQTLAAQPSIPPSDQLGDATLGRAL